MRKLYTTLLMSLSLLVVAINPLQATSFEPIEGGRLAYEKGTFDPFSFNADIEDATMFFDDGSSMTIQHLLAKSRIDEQAEIQYIDRLLLQGVKFEGVGGSFSIPLIDLRDGVSSDTVNWGNLSPLIDGEGLAMRDLQIKGATLHMPTVGNLTIEKLALEVDTDWENFEEAREGDMLMEVINAVWVSDRLLPGAHAKFLERVLVNGELEYNLELKGENIITNERLDLEIDDYFTINFKSSHQIANKSLDTLLELDPDDPENFKLTLEAVHLRGIEVQLMDNGLGQLLRESFITSVSLSDPSEQIDEMIASMRPQITAVAPRHGEAMLDAVAEWLSNGGVLSITASPAEGIPYAKIYESIVFLQVDSLIDTLGLQVRRRDG